MTTEKTLLLTEFAQNFEFLKKFDDVRLQQLQRRQTKFDSIPPLQKTRSSRFHQLNPKIWQDHLKKKHKYYFVHDIAIENLRRVLVKQLSIFYDTHMCEEPLYIVEELPNRAFSWDRKDFLRRREMDTVWVDVIRKQMSEECLEIRKFKFDLRELRRYQRLIFDAFLSANEATTDAAKSKMFKYLHESIKATTEGERMQEELSQNRQAITALSVIYLTMMQGKAKDPKPYQHKLFLEKTVMDGEVIDPLRMRYQYNSYKDRVNQFQEKSDTTEENLVAEIKRYVQKMDYEQYCSHNALLMFNSAIENYKRRIVILSVKYEEKFEEMDNKLSYKKVSLEKLKDQHHFLQEQLVRFREELEHLRNARRQSELRRKAEEVKSRRSTKKSKQSLRKDNKKGKQNVK